MSECIEIMEILGVESSKEELNIYPNPVEDYVRLSLQPSSDEVSIRSTDINGRLIKKVENVSDDIITLDTSSLPEGLYLIHLATKEKPDEFVTYKFLIKH